MGVFSYTTTDRVVAVARVSRDLWGTTHVDVTEEVKRARRDERFRSDMGRVSTNFDNDMAGAVGTGIIGAAAVGVGTVALGASVVKNRRFRYKLEAVLHFPFAVMVVFVTVAIIGGRVSDLDDETAVRLLLVALVISVPVSIVWSIAYIRMRTLPKLRALRY